MTGFDEQSQQQQQPKLEDDIRSVWKQRAGKVRGDTKHATEVERASRKLVLPTSEAEGDTHVTLKEEFTDSNAKEIEKI